MKAFGEFFNNQIEYATTIILSRSEEMDQSKLDETVALLKEKNDKALIVTTSLVRLDGAKILSAIEGKENLEVSMRHTQHALTLTSDGLRTQPHKDPLLASSVESVSIYIPPIIR